ncbi:MAG: MlaE family ABC transporter permease [Oceanipulchritudo sp.]
MPGIRTRVRPDGNIVIELKEAASRIHPAACQAEMEEALAKVAADARVLFVGNGSAEAGSLFVGTLLQCIRLAKGRGLPVETATLPPAVRKLVELSLAVSPEEAGKPEQAYFIGEIGRRTVAVLKDVIRFVGFLGELIHSFGRFLRGRARFRQRDFWVTLQECGVNALGIVGLLALLTGIILAFIGAVQLKKFGATIYVTDLVGLAMAREMGCIMTGVIMSGRTGAAFAAQIGSMNVNQEVDALKTLGLSPVEFLVLPRSLAMILMMPLLTIYAIVIGWIGGFLVAVPMDINPSEFWNQLTETLTLEHIAFGVGKSFFFGIIVAGTGCYHGLLSGRNSAAVGQAATRAVVAGITWIVVLDALFAFIDEVIN